MPERGDLVLVPFPFTDLSAVKRRPVLAHAGDAYGDFIALPVTSRPQSEHAVAISASDLADGQLPKDSWVRTNRIVTLNDSLVIKTVGRVADPVVDQAVAQACAYLGLKDRT